MKLLSFWRYKNHHLTTSFILMLASISIAYQWLPKLPKKGNVIFEQDLRIYLYIK